MSRPAILAVVIYVTCFHLSATRSLVDKRLLNDDDVDFVLSDWTELDKKDEPLDLTYVRPWKAPNDTAPSIALTSNGPLPRDCADLFDMEHRTSGVYTIYVGRRRRPLAVYCDMTTSGGGWTVFQKRTDGSLNFYNGWTHYTNGFGSVHGEYWLGNANIHALILDKKYTLRVDLTDFSSNKRYAEYTDFKIGSACEKYKLLSIGTYCGDAGDALAYHVGSKFTTPDQDNDERAGASCAVSFRGAWWYKNCHNSNLNGHYLRGQHASNADGVNWYQWHGHNYSLKSTEMKIRPADFTA